MKYIKKRILYGGATAPSQYEGAYNLNGKVLDTQDLRKYLKREEKSTTITRLISKDTLLDNLSNLNNDEFPFREASRGIEYFNEDMELLKELGIEIYRFGISWARIYKDENSINYDGLWYYKKLFKFLRENNIKSFVSISHYAIPIDLVLKYGGWKNRKLIDLYVKYAEVIFKEFGEYIDYFIPINEINTGYYSPYNGLGLLKEGNYNLNEIFQGLHNQFVASAKIIKLSKEYSKALAGCMIADFCYYPYSCNPLDNIKTTREEQKNQWFYTDVLVRGYYPNYMLVYFEKNNISLEVKNEDFDLLREYTADFVAISYYQSCVISHKELEKSVGNLVVSTKNPYLIASEWGWEIDPLGLRTALHKIYDRYNKPIIISENGLGARDKLENNRIRDDYRIEYLKNHFKELEKASDEGVDIIAYLMWGIIDIVSAGSCEMEKRYGVIYVDRDNHSSGTYKRYKKDSFYWYKKYLEER